MTTTRKTKAQLEAIQNAELAKSTLETAQNELTVTTGKIESAVRQLELATKSAIQLIREGHVPSGLLAAAAEVDQHLVLLQWQLDSVAGLEVLADTWAEKAGELPQP